MVVSAAKIRSARVLPPLTDVLAPVMRDEPDARQVLVSLLAICFFPFAHSDTLLAPLGLDADAPEFVAERKAHVLRLLHHLRRS
jgi:hypothetical protein